MLDAYLSVSNIHATSFNWNTLTKSLHTNVQLKLCVCVPLNKNMNVFMCVYMYFPNP